MRNQLEFIVSCDHVSPQYRLDNQRVTVQRDSGLNMWSWSYPGFGSSKYSASPEGAIEDMLHAHSCRLIRIKAAD